MQKRQVNPNCYKKRRLQPSFQSFYLALLLNRLNMTTTNKPSLALQSFPVLEMTCASCALSVEDILKKTPGVETASVNYANQVAQVAFDSTLVKPADLQKAVQAGGYNLILDQESAPTQQALAQDHLYERLKNHALWAFFLATPVVVLEMFWMNAPYGHYFSMVLTGVIVFLFGQSFFKNAWKQARLGKANMDTLVALSTGIAFLFSAFNTVFPEFWHSRGIHPHVYFEAAAVVIIFILLGKLLEERAKSSTSSALKKLMGLQPKTVRVKVNEAEFDLPIKEVQAGQCIVIRPGEKIPVDGIVLRGSSFIDESMISGESIAVEKNMGDRVFAGTINQKGSFEFEAQHVGAETVLAQIIASVQQAQGSKAPVQKLVDKIAGVFVPAVMGIAIFTFVIWMTFGGEQAFTHALLTSITVLVVACPCALGLATPTAIMVGMGKGAEKNILIKDAESLELANRVNAIVFDKTGTITEGKPNVIGLEWEPTENRHELQKVLTALEQRSEHPLADAVVALLGQPESKPIERFENIPGRGITGWVDGQQYYVGNQKLMQEKDCEISITLNTVANTWATQAYSLIWFSNATRVLAVAAVADRIRDSAANTISTLMKRGIDVYMLTGDNQKSASTVAEKIGLQNFRAEVLPADKLAFIKQLQAQGKIVAMVGDGINDSPALAQANISIAMGKGSDIAIDAAKITLISSDLGLINKALNLSHQTVSAIRQNLFWAFVYNLIAIPLAAGVLYPVNGFLLNPMIAGAAMALSSVSVVSNSLRLKLKKL